MKLLSKRPILFLATAVLCIVLPAWILVDPEYQSMSMRALIVINLVCTWGFFLMSSLLCNKLDNAAGRMGCRLLATAAAIYYLFITFEIFYKVYSGMYFDLFYFLDSFDEVAQVIINVFGVWKFFGMLLGFLVLGVVYYILFRAKFRILNQLQHFQWSVLRSAPVLFVLFLGMIYIPSASGQLSPSAVREISEARKQIEILSENREDFSTGSSTDNVFITQLESGNGIALRGEAVVDGQKFEGNFYPTIQQIFRKGVWFPYFLAQSPMTNRGQVNILCGLTNQIATALSYHPEEIPVACLPELMAQQGYTTIAFRSDDLSFSNTGNFFKEIGFQEVHNEDIMKPEDPSYDWGYDDCTFYNRAFDYLEEKYPNPQKLFVYFEVSSHHYPFTLKDQYAFLAPFQHMPVSQALGQGKLPQRIPFIEQYLNSFKSQDYCVGSFYRRYRAYAEENSHLFTMPDHSWPLGMHKNTQSGKDIYLDNTMTFLGYLPPKAQQETLGGRVISEWFTQTDLLPTIDALFDGTAKGNSFADVLQNKPLSPNYEACTIQVQPYSGGELSVIQGKKKFVYSIAHQTVVFYDLEKDFYEEHPTVIAQEVTYEAFRDEYYCHRYEPLFVH